MNIDFSRNKNYHDFQSNCTDLVKYIVKNEFSKYKFWNSIDLSPSLERYLYVLFMNDKKFLKNIIGKNKKINRENLSLNISKFDHKPFFHNILIRKLVDKVKHKEIKYFEKYSSKEIIVFVHHQKFVDFIKKSGIYGKKVIWVAINNKSKIKKTLGKDEDVVSLPQGLEHIKQNKIINPITDLANKIDILLKIIKPKYSIFCEGDAPYHSLVSEISSSHDIKSICIQWGIFFSFKKKIGFSNIKASYFFAWGNYFAREIEILNPDLKVKIYGYPNKEFQSYSRKKSKKILFLGSSYGTFITKKCFNDFISIIIEVSKSLKDYQIVYRPHPQPHLLSTDPDANDSEIIDILNLNKIVIDKSNNLYENLSQSLISVGMLSSSLMEAMFLDSIPVSYNPTTIDYPIDFQKLEIGIINQNKDYIINKLIELANNDSLIEYYQNKIIEKKEEFFLTHQTSSIPEFIVNNKL